MNANELRVDNIIIYNGRCMIVDDIFRDQLFLHDFEDTISNFFTYLEVEPIPLTSDILEACGFVWTANIHRWVHGCGYRVIQHDHGFDNGIGDASFSQPPLKHLHQLQNLFFALTGTELTINLEKVKV